MPIVDEDIKRGLEKGNFVVQSDGTIECADTIELRPTRGGPHWTNAVDFHRLLTVTAATPSSGDDLNSTDYDENSLFLTFEAKARECLDIALSPIPKFTRKNTIVVRLGGLGNTETTISFNNNNIAKGAATTSLKRVTGRVCRHDKWVRYWLCYQQGKVSVGIGDIVAPEGDERCIASLQLPSFETAKDNSMAQSFEDEETEAQEIENGTDTGTTMEGEKEKISTKAIEATGISFRAVGFRNASVGDRQAPTPLLIRFIRLSRLVPLNVMNRFVALTQEGASVEDDMVILGHDELSALSTTNRQAVQLLLDHKDACIKARARAIKFKVPYLEPDLTTSLNWSDARRLKANPTSQRAFATGMDLSSKDEVEKRNKRKERFKREARTAVVAPTLVVNNDENEKNGNWLPLEQAWDKIDLSGMQRMDPPTELWLNNPSQVNQESFAMVPPTFVKQKVHIFSMDWAAFKQIRTVDILNHFAEFGPTYVEWLGDLSCNILFEDEYSAARVLNCMAQALPFGKDPDLGRMGWRFCKSYLRKDINDKFGRKGTTARLLMRLATSIDVLQDRPSWWPKPPAGFSKKKVLGPESDLPKPNSSTDVKHQTTQQEKNKRHAPIDTEEMLNGALSSSRGGFSLEDIIAERASKRTKSSG